MTLACYVCGNNLEFINSAQARHHSTTKALNTLISIYIMCKRTIIIRHHKKLRIIPFGPGKDRVKIIDKINNYKHARDETLFLKI